MTAKRIKEVDVLYSIGVILAVFGHSHPIDWNVFNGTLFYHTIVFIYTFHMPLFFAIAGILLANSKSIVQKPFGLFIEEKALKLLTPYIVLTIFFIIPKGYIEYGNFEFLSFHYLIKIIFSPRDNIWGHFWFLPVLFILYFIFGLFKKATLKLAPRNSNIILLLVSGALLFLNIHSNHITNWFGINDICKFAFYMTLGMLLLPLINNYKSENHFYLIFGSILPFAISFCLYTYFYNNRLIEISISLLMLFSLFLFAKLIKNKFQKTINLLSKNVFTIYIYSWLFQSITLIVLERLSFPWQFSIPIVFLIGIVCPLIIAIIYNRFKKLNCRFFDLVLGMR
jgi:fucose 4-O-acetylase-like acetyltransferase